MKTRKDGAGREVWAGLHLLDRQLVDRDGRLAGNADDIELEPGDDGKALFATGIYSGPGALSYRFGWRRFGRWRERAHAALDADVRRLSPIPFALVTELGSSIHLAADADDLPASASEKWVRDHLVGRIPGSDHAPE